MTQNLFIGASLSRILDALQYGPESAELQLAIQQTLAIALGPNNFYLRAGAIAESINTAKPDLVGLQEVTTILGAVEGATSLVPLIDFKAVLLPLLPDYETVIETFDGNFLLPGGGLQTSNMILKKKSALRPDLVVANPRSGIYAASGLSVGGQQAERNWQAVDVAVGARIFVFLNTHLESETDPVSTSQALELIAGPLNTHKKVIAVGDFNSGPGQVLGAYNALTEQAKLRDVVIQGNTCCRDELLTNPEDANTPLLERIDLVLTSRSITLISGERVNVDQVSVGQNTVYPSDHVGVVARLRVW